VDFDLLQIVKNRENYLRFKPYIKEHALSKEAQKLLNTVDEFFRYYPAVKDIDWNAFESYFMVRHMATLTRESAPTYRTIINKLKSEPATAAAEDVLRHYISCDFATRIANEAVKGADADLDAIGKLVNQYDKEVGRAIDKLDLFVGDDAMSLATSSDPGLEWRLEELNISCGPLRQGDFVIVGARPETGKTTFLADQVSYMGEQMAHKHERPIVWVNNEERSSKVKRRIMQAALGITLKDFEKDVPAAVAVFQKKMGMVDRILVTGSSAGLNSVKHLTPLFREHNPAMIVFDQLDKVAGFSREDREDLRLGSLYQWARDLAHEYGPVIAASQASEGAEGQQWVYQHQLRGSKTDKAGEADAIITIGKVHDPAKELKRYIHVPKNKLDGGPRSEEKERHGFWEVEIKPEIARYEGTR
jgi:replicative DNA helicase